MSESSQPGSVTAEMRARADQISRLVTELHPLSSRLTHVEARNEILRALFELTKQVEVVKKHLRRADQADESALV